ncbi:hypothetical protein PoB_001611200 [Plakobranchus ocellatus]|uniref:Uncharacterized protein n=1 Tax=Plakobranchus ocellatus TaxID=259542 RepID=A0AAV3Z4W1_9GAST|nr:hypothetical protein PoB_001611200 [Plakobranchus ocellatus]
MIKSQDPNIAILQYRNTQYHRSEIFSAQLLFNRRLRDNILTAKINLKPAIPAKARQGLEARQQKQTVLEFIVNTKLEPPGSTLTVIKLCRPTGTTHAL